MKEISKNNILFRDPNTNEWVPIPAVTTGGATAEQVAQIEKNTSDISQLSEDIANKGGNVSASYDGNGTIVFGNSSNTQSTQYENGDEVSY